MEQLGTVTWRISLGRAHHVVLLGTSLVCLESAGIPGGRHDLVPMGKETERTVGDRRPCRGNATHSFGVHSQSLGTTTTARRLDETGLHRQETIGKGRFTDDERLSERMKRARKHAGASRCLWSGESRAGGGGNIVESNSQVRCICLMADGETETQRSHSRCFSSAAPCMAGLGRRAERLLWGGAHGTQEKQDNGARPLTVFHDGTGSTCVSVLCQRRLCGRHLP